ncbi:MAG: 4-alpha-glucanotransferase [Sedimenticola sp.]|nr:4-alpha-glucanotransferase [Sedimenticola sp.]
MDKSRCAGVLLHPTSLPGPLNNGDIGHEAYRFIEFLYANGLKVWQMLPLGPTHEDNSPYQCLSAHAGNPELISLDWLADREWLALDKIKSVKTDQNYRAECLRQAIHTFQKEAGDEWRTRLSKFKIKHSYWLEEYALFVALKNKFQMLPWYLWPVPFCQRFPDALKMAADELSEEIDRVIIEQFIFFTQWQEIRSYADRFGIKIFGDMPIFVAHDSVDVWAHRSNFKIDADGNMTSVAGVPPDAFSDTGQKWGNPLYDWDYMQQDGFRWWVNRVTTQIELYDWIRIDHFRGLDACWEIPINDETAENGQWRDVPGEALLSVLYETFHNLPIIAEDLGVITERVIKLKNSFRLPGMKVLQFAFDGNTHNPHLPHQHKQDDVIYTGTHDNDTTAGWLKDEKSFSRKYFMVYSGCCNDSDAEKIRSMWRMALSSVSFLCMFPMQDLLLLDSAARMNTPGSIGGNWSWRFNWQQVRPEVLKELAKLITVYQR